MKKLKKRPKMFKKLANQLKSMILAKIKKNEKIDKIKKKEILSKSLLISSKKMLDNNLKINKEKQVSAFDYQENNDNKLEVKMDKSADK